MHYLRSLFWLVVGLLFEPLLWCVGVFVLLWYRRDK